MPTKHYFIAECQEGQANDWLNSCMCASVKKCRFSIGLPHSTFGFFFFYYFVDEWWWLQWRAVSSKTPKLVCNWQQQNRNYKLPCLLSYQIYVKPRLWPFFFFFFPFVLVWSNPYHQRRFLLVVLGFKDFKGLGLRVQNAIIPSILGLHQISC